MKNRLADDQTDVGENAGDVRGANHRARKSRAETVLQATGEGNEVGAERHRTDESVNQKIDSLKRKNRVVQRSWPIFGLTVRR